MKKKLKFLFSALLLVLFGTILPYQVKATSYSEDIQEAYEWAYKNGIISESPIDNAGLYDALTNAELAKIMVGFQRYLGIEFDGEPVESCRFDQEPSEEISNLCLMYGLGRMDEGIVGFDDANTNTNRAIFGTALSKALWGDKYEGGNPYYVNHLNALKEAGIINQINNPESTTEIKGYVLTILKRASGSNDEDLCELCLTAMGTGIDICKSVCKEKIEIFKLKPGLNSFSTPAVLESISFSNGGNNISFAKMVNGRWTPVTFNNSNVRSVIRPLEGFIVRNSNNSDVTMTIVYDTDIDINDALHQKQLDAGWNFLGITKTDNPFGTIANAIVSDIIDFTAGKTNKIDLSNLRYATSFMLGKAYGVFVNNSNGIYGGINNSNAGPNATLVNNLTKTVVFISNETSTKRVFKGKYTALKGEGSFINTIHIQNADDVCYDNCPISGKIEFCFIIKGDEYCESFKDINNVDRYIEIEDSNLDINESVDIVVDATYEGNYGTGTKNFEIGLSENYGFDGEIWGDLAPIKITDEINDDTFSILTTTQKETVNLKANNSKLAEFIIKPNEGNSTNLRELSLEIDGPGNQGDNIRLEIDGTEYEPISLNDGTITYQPDEQIPSEGVSVRVILEQELEYDDYTIGVNIKSINGKLVGKTFSKRFVSALVYISKQENKGDYTKFTLGVDKYDDDYSIESVCLLTGSTGAGTCLMGENSDDGPFEDGFTFNVNNSDFVQPINYIFYLMENSKRNSWADSIRIEREDYPDYFKVNGTIRKIFSNNNYSGNTQCIGMDMASINHTINGDKITLKWSPVDGDEVEISVFDPKQETYLNLGTVDMIEGEFIYTKQRTGEHNFKLSNGCKQVNYKIDA